MINKEYVIAAFVIGLGIGMLYINLIFTAPQCNECPECRTPEYDDCFSVWEVEVQDELIPVLFKVPMGDVVIDLGYMVTSTCKILEERCTLGYYDSTCEWEPITKTCRCYVISKELVNKTGHIYLSAEFDG